MTEIEAKLRESIGLDAAILGRPSLTRAVHLQMQSLGLTSVNHYVQLLGVSPAHWRDLVESVVVAETWFYREPEAFAGLARFALEEWLPKARVRPLRILSVPCASGEEPYSMAMALLDAGLSPGAFRIDAIDLSVRALARARKAVYGKNAFRNRQTAFRARYFRSTAEGFLLRPEARQPVSFQAGNLLEPASFAPKPAQYHCIFCRNLLIYFDPMSQVKALANLQRMLHPQGVLFVGSAEQALALGHGFAPGPWPAAFVTEAFRSSSRSPVPPRRGVRLTSWPSAEASDRSFEPFSITEESLPPGAPGRPLAAGPDLEHARRLADAGRLREAALLCESYLRLNQDCAQAYYLLGRVREAAGQPNALECYRRALYLEPRHRETLLQMSVLAARSGDGPLAVNLRRRAERIKPPSEPS